MRTQEQDRPRPGGQQHQLDNPPVDILQRNDKPYRRIPAPQHRHQPADRHHLLAAHLPFPPAGAVFRDKGRLIIREGRGGVGKPAGGNGDCPVRVHRHRFDPGLIREGLDIVAEVGVKAAGEAAARVLLHHAVQVVRPGQEDLPGGAVIVAVEHHPRRRDDKEEDHQHHPEGADHPFAGDPQPCPAALLFCHQGHHLYPYPQTVWR